MGGTQRYRSEADWEYIKQCTINSPIPVIANGDIYNYKQAELLQESGITGLMIGRGALIKPWIFTEIKEKRDWDISSSERFEILKQYTNMGLEHWGSDSSGVENTRNFLLEWLSFTCRYVPVGILERFPTKINDRAPSKIYGRDDLEILLSKDNPNDWIKITERLLGPVRDTARFSSFKPKHEANAWTSGNEPVKEETIINESST